MKIRVRHFIFMLIFLMHLFVFAQNTVDALPDTQGAKAFLEELISRRYRQELATLVDSSSFQLGTRLELIKISDQAELQKNKEGTWSEIPIISDLSLGSIDPDQILKDYAAPSDALKSHPLLENYKIKGLSMTVGLRAGLKDNTKKVVEKWLKERIKKEFGALGKGIVTNIESPIESKPIPIPKDAVDWLNQFQSLAGQLILAMALLVGVILWRLLGRDSTTSTSKVENTTPERSVSPRLRNSPSGTFESESSEGDRSLEEVIRQEERENSVSIEGLKQFSDKVKGLLPHLPQHFEKVVRAWCQQGEVGRLRLAVFSESVGQEVGRLPIPIDALGDMGRTFSRMTEVSPKEKLETLKKVYWDLVSVVNLGPEILNQPFGYLSGMNIHAVNQILMDQNPKLKTLVSVFMPSEMRARYLKSLELSEKQNLLITALNLDSIPSAELQNLEASIQAKVQPSKKKDLVYLERTFSKLVEALRPSEELSILSVLENPGLFHFRQSHPSIAFLHQWPDDKLRLFLSRVSPDEILPYLRIKPDLQSRFMDLLPPLTAEVIKEELEKRDKLSLEDKDHWLLQLRIRITQMVDLKEINLEEIFSDRAEIREHDAA